MKKIWLSLGILILAIMIIGCGNKGNIQKVESSAVTTTTTASPSAGSTDKYSGLAGKKVLIAYFSYSGNNIITAQTLRAKVGGDVYVIGPAVAYGNDYAAVSAQGRQEVRNGFKPALKNPVPDLSKYDVIFLGSPIWWGSMAPPVATFLSEAKLDGKIIAPFCSHAGFGAANYFDDIAKAAPNAKVIPGVSLDRRGIEGADIINGKGEKLTITAEERSKYPSPDQEFEKWLQNIKL